MTETTFKGAYLPVVTGDSGTWGTLLNTTTFPVFDANLGGFAVQSLSGTNVTLTAGQDAFAGMRFTGTLSANIVVTTACEGFKFVENKTSGSYTVTVTNGVGTSCVIPQGSGVLLFIDPTYGVRAVPDLSGVAGQVLTVGAMGALLLAATTGLVAKSLLEVRQSVTASTSTLTIDMASGWNVNLTLAANVSSVVFNNWPASGTLGRLTLDITSTGSYTISGWPGVTRWPYGTPPTITPSGRDTLVITGEGGSNFRGFVAGQGMA